MSYMGLTHSTARWLAPASLLFDFAAQQYGMFSKPNMKDIHDQNLSFFSPQPLFIAAFFFPQQILQIWWLYRLYRTDPKRSAADKRSADLQTDYAPFYILANLCLGFWMFFWNASALKSANAFIILNTLAQLYYMTTRLRTLDTSSPASYLTHAVCKTFAGLAVLDILHNTSVAYFKDAHATTVVRALTGVGFVLGSAASDWIFGVCLVYDLVALAAGQYGSWRNLLGIYALVCAGVVVVKNLLRPPYERKSEAEYAGLPTREEDV